MTENFEPVDVGNADQAVDLASPSSRRAFIATGAAVGVAAWAAPQLRRFGGAIAGAGTLGVITNYPATPGSLSSTICLGPDNALWFTNVASSSIGRITTGGVITNYPSSGSDVSGPFVICVGPDGALWFTNSGNSSIGRIDTGVSAS